MPFREDLVWYNLSGANFMYLLLPFREYLVWYNLSGARIPTSGGGGYGYG